MWAFEKFILDVERAGVTHISSGSGEGWCVVVVVDNDDGTQGEQGICGVATTPGGVFHFERRVAGWRNSKLGRLRKHLGPSTTAGHEIVDGSGFHQTNTTTTTCRKYRSAGAQRGDQAGQVMKLEGGQHSCHGDCTPQRNLRT